jgi:hypothetical protein
MGPRGPQRIAPRTLAESGNGGRRNFVAFCVNTEAANAPFMQPRHAPVRARADTSLRRHEGARCEARRLEPAISRYRGAVSRVSVAIASCTVVMNCAGKMMVEFFSTEISAMVCNVRSCSATGCWVMMSAAWPSRTAA